MVKDFNCSELRLEDCLQNCYNLPAPSCLSVDPYRLYKEYTIIISLYNFFSSRLQLSNCRLLGLYKEKAIIFLY